MSEKRPPVRALAIAALGLVLASVPMGSATPAEGQEAQGLMLEAVEVTPEKPGAETLCQLRVRIANRGDRPASALAFRVAVEGTELEVYDRQLFYQVLPAGETSEVRLFNFWTSETGRDWPEDGRLDVEVTLVEAEWLEIAIAEDVETWTPQGAVEGLPSTVTITLGG